MVVSQHAESKPGGRLVVPRVWGTHCSPLKGIRAMPPAPNCLVPHRLPVGAELSAAAKGQLPLWTCVRAPFCIEV